MASGDLLGLGPLETIVNVGWPTVHGYVMITYEYVLANAATLLKTDVTPAPQIFLFGNTFDILAEQFRYPPVVPPTVDVPSRDWLTLKRRHLIWNYPPYKLDGTLVVPGTADLIDTAIWKNSFGLETVECVTNAEARILLGEPEPFPIFVVRVCSTVPNPDSGDVTLATRTRRDVFVLPFGKLRLANDRNNQVDFTMKVGAVQTGAVIHWKIKVETFDFIDDLPMETTNIPVEGPLSPISRHTFEPFEPTELDISISGVLCTCHVNLETYEVTGEATKINF